MPRKFIKWLTVMRAGAGPERILEEGRRHKDRVWGGAARSAIVKTHQSSPQKSGTEQRPLGDKKWARGARQWESSTLGGGDRDLRLQNTIWQLCRVSN